jgi:hypothetical protein
MKAISIVDAGATPPSSSCGFAICAIPIVRPVRRRREGRPFWATRDFRQDRFWPDSVQVLGGTLSSGLPALHGCGSLPVCSPPGVVDEAWLKKGLPCS